MAAAAVAAGCEKLQDAAMLSSWFLAGEGGVGLVTRSWPAEVHRGSACITPGPQRVLVEVSEELRSS